MSTVFDPNADEAQNGGSVSQGQGSPSANSQASAASQSSAAGTPIGTGGGAGAGPVAPSASKPGTSGQFTNIQNYINANQGNNLGQQTENQFNNLKQQGENQLGSQVSGFDQNAAATGQAIQNEQSAVNAAPSQVVNPNNFQQGLSALQSGLGYQYNGPTGLQNTAGLQNQAQNLSTLGGLTNSDAGRFTLLQKFFNTPTYTQGQTNLDNVLLGSQPQALQQVRQTANSLGNDVNSAVGNAASQVSQLQNQAQGVQQAAQNAVGTGAQNIYGQLGTEANNFITQGQALQNNPNATGVSLAGPYGLSQNLTPQQAAQLGLESFSGSTQLGQIAANPTSFYGQVDPTLAANYNTLASLSPSSIPASTLPTSITTGGTPLTQGSWQTNANPNPAVDAAYQSALNNIINNYNEGSPTQGASNGQETITLTPYSLQTALQNGWENGAGNGTGPGSYSSQAAQAQQQALQGLLQQYAANGNNGQSLGTVIGK
jgi:hypothetical protein